MANNPLHMTDPLGLDESNPLGIEKPNAMAPVDGEEIAKNDNPYAGNNMYSCHNNPYPDFTNVQYTIQKPFILSEAIAEGFKGLAADFVDFLYATSPSLFGNLKADKKYVEEAFRRTLQERLAFLEDPSILLENLLNGVVAALQPINPLEMIENQKIEEEYYNSLSAEEKKIYDYKKVTDFGVDASLTLLTLKSTKGLNTTIGLTRGKGFVVKNSKFDYFFGRVKSGSLHNIQRSAQNLKDLTKLGIKNNSELMTVFNSAFSNKGKYISTFTNSFGTTEFSKF